jgi:hypothetical protein
VRGARVILQVFDEEASPQHHFLAVRHHAPRPSDRALPGSTREELQTPLRVRPLPSALPPWPPRTGPPLSQHPLPPARATRTACTHARTHLTSLLWFLILLRKQER